jgi:hypothetical protein
VTFTFFAEKAPRYALFWIPAFVYFAVGPLTASWQQKWIRYGQVVVILALLTGYSRFGWVYQPPFVAGYGSLVKQMMQANGPIVVLFDGNLGADFISHVRQLDTQRRCTVLRKELYATRWMNSYGRVELVHTQSQIADLINRYGVRFIVVEEGVPFTDGAPSLVEGGGRRM